MASLPTDPKFRLFCESCTGIAEYSNEAKDGKSVVCANCGKTTPQKKENYIPLTESEKRRLKVQMDAQSATSKKK